MGYVLLGFQPALIEFWHPPPPTMELFCYSIHYPNIVINMCVDNFMLFISVLQQLSTISTGFVCFFAIVLVVL